MSTESWLQRQEREEKAARGMIDRLNDSPDEPESRTHCAESSNEYTGGSVSYYKVHIGAPLSGHDAYTAECNDIIEALGMSYAEGNVFKAIWRMCAARTLRMQKRGYTDGLYDAEKVVFFGSRIVKQQERKR